MNLSVGIVGLPNVGKSTLFNALLKKQVAFVANYPFATIEPNIGVVPVPDERLKKLQGIVSHASTPGVEPPIVPATVKFVDIAGLAKGANQGQGLGNKFLSHIREVSIIAHVVRAFEDPSTGSGQAPIIREGSVDPKTDYETIKTELILADLSTISKIKDQKSKTQIKYQKEAAEKLFNALNNGIPAREVELLKEEKEIAKTFFLLSDKPEIIVLNVSEQALKNAEEIKQNYAELLGASSDPPAGEASKLVVICAKIEAELAELSEKEQRQYLADLGLEESGLERLIKKAYETLGLISFLTAGEKEVRAWTIEKGTKAVDAAGVIHTDFTKNFIKAEVISFEDYVKCKGRKKAKELGLARLEGRDYIIQDGDVVEFKIGQ